MLGLMKIPPPVHTLALLPAAAVIFLQPPAVSAQDARESAATPAGEAEAAPEAAPTRLSPEYMKLIGESALLFQQQQFEAATDQLDKADAIRMETPIALNMRGAIATETGDYELARGHFEKALDKDATYFAPRFNLGEILFLEGKFAEAREHFENMLDEMENNELLQYKIFLCYLMQGQMEAAREKLGQIKFPSDTPAYYYANAALEFHQDNETEARSWIDSSQRIFGQRQNIFFMQSLADLGYLSSDEIARPEGTQTVDRGERLERAAGAGLEASSEATITGDDQ